MIVKEIFSKYIRKTASQFPISGAILTLCLLHRLSMQPKMKSLLVALNLQRILATGILPTLRKIILLLKQGAHIAQPRQLFQVVALIWEIKIISSPFGSEQLTQKSYILNTVSYSVTSNNDWVYVEHKLSNPTSVELITNEFQIDELRLYPANAQMTTYCYDELLRVHTLTDANNKSSFYTYDELSRLTQIRDHNGNLRSLNTYNYGSN